MKFAFLAHPLSQEHRALMAVDDSGGLRKSWGGDLFQFCQQLHQNLNAYHHSGSLPDDEVRVVDQFNGLVSANGARCDGRFYEIPLDAQQILDEPHRALALMESAVDDAASWGAEIVGLGSMTGIVGGQGEHLATRGPVAITTGNSLTVFSAIENLKHACEVNGIRLAEETVAVIGIPGSIGSALAKIVKPLCKSLICVARTESGRARQLSKSLDARLTTAIPDALQTARVILSATSAGDCIDQNWLLPGSLVIDVAVPTDVIGNRALRDDILILTGGMSMTPETMSRESMFIGFNHGMVPSCFGETMLLALEDRRECYSIGRKLSVEGISEIGAVAVKHGFDFTNLSCFGIPVDGQQLSNFKKAVYRTRNLNRKDNPLLPNHDLAQRNGHGAVCAVIPHLKTPQELSGSAVDRHRRFINPVLAALGKQSGFLKTFVRGEGCYLWDDKDQQFLDFVAGFGSVNLGHNPPAVVDAIQTAIVTKAPGFAQSAVNPYASALADRLVACAPAGLEMVSFGNSGAEAVEAAIKLVKASSERKRFLYCHGSYHGKTLGALSLTGNRKYRQPFEPLIDHMDAVEFGDTEGLASALNSKQYAAFFVEPIQCEGGMQISPPGYLNDVESICRRTGTLLVLDEIQTGMGRTGKLFCADHYGLKPDIMTLAKSLGGGMVPAAAMLCRRDLWLAAYGSVERFTLHTSTFAGGSLAMAAGLATLDVLEHSDLMHNCEQRSIQLLNGLREIANDSDLICDVRGQGLLIGIEFNPLPSNIVRHFAANDTTGVNQFLAPHAIDSVRNLTPIYVMQTMLDEFGIYTQVARSKPNVIRVQPPLSITEDQVSEFLTAIEKCCSEFSFSNRITDTMIAKSTVGNLDKGKTVAN